MRRFKWNQITFHIVLKDTMHKFYILFLLLFAVEWATAQEYHGTTGLLRVPCAETAEAGTFRGYMNVLSKHFTPDQQRFEGSKYHTFSYGVGIAFFSWLEISYSASLLKFHKNGQKDKEVGYFNEDRRVNFKLRPIKEGPWWPAVAVGMDDVGRFDRIAEGDNGNNYYQNIYFALSKHFDVKGSELGVHADYVYYTTKANKDRRGVVGGLTLRPSFFRPLRFVAEYDTQSVNVGADALLWRHLFLQASLVDGHSITAGIGYHYRIPY